jgi:hypothetical protein
MTRIELVLVDPQTEAALSRFDHRYYGYLCGEEAAELG